MPLDHFTLHRQPDGAALTFAAVEPRFGCIAYAQVDGPLWVQWHPRRGWCLTDGTGAVTGLPLDVPKADQRHRPPAGAWLNRGAAGPEVYDLGRAATGVRGAA